MTLLKAGGAVCPTCCVYDDSYYPKHELEVTMETGHAISEYLEDCRYRGLSAKSLENYTWALDYLLRACPDLPAARRELRTVLSAPALGVESRKDLRRRLDTFFRWAAREYGHANPLDDLAKPPNRKQLPRILADPEVAALWDAADWQRDRALIALILDTGLRLGEVAALRWADVGEGFLIVSTEGKTGSRRVPLSPEVRELMHGLGDQTHIWIGKYGALTTSGVQQAYKRLFKRAGIVSRKNGPHTLRHAFATNYLRSGGKLAVLQAILGHRSVKTTMIYVHLAGTDVDADHAIHSPIHRFGLADRMKPDRVMIPRWERA